MSRDAKRTWSEQVEEVDNDQNDLNEKMNPDSRENSNSRKKSKPNSDSKQSKPKKPVELETDPVILQRRQKQIDYGKNTIGYANFSHLIPQEQRTKEHPKTPDKYSKYSRRAWDMLIKIWRKKLHEFDSDAINSYITEVGDDAADSEDDVDDGEQHHHATTSSPPGEGGLNISLSFLDD